MVNKFIKFIFLGQVSVKVDDIEEPENLLINFGPVLEKNDNMNYDIVNESIMNVVFFDANKVDAKNVNSICFFDNKKAIIDFERFENRNREVKEFIYPLEETANYHIGVIAESSSDNSYLAYSTSYIYVNMGDGVSAMFVCKE